MVFQTSRIRAMHDKDADYPILARKPASELAEERREQIALERAARQADKDRRYAQQRAMDAPPERRIALWEARHGLALPRSADHPLMQFIADSTDLALEQVQAEQRRRAQVRGTSGP
jgi:hypothetical protein